MNANPQDAVALFSLLQLHRRMTRHALLQTLEEIWMCKYVNPQTSGLAQADKDLDPLSAEVQGCVSAQVIVYPWPCCNV